MLWHKAGITSASKGEGVDEKEAENHNDAAEDAPPQLLVHQRLSLLLPVDEILHGGIERVQSPHVEGCQGAGERKNDQEHQGTRAIGRDGQTGDGVDDRKDEMRDSQDTDVDHGPAQGGLDHTVAHADDQEEEKREGISACIEDCHKDHQCLAHAIQAMSVLVVCIRSASLNGQNKLPNGGIPVVP